MQTPYTELAELLRLAAPEAEPGRLAENIQQGLPVAVLYEVARLIAPINAEFVFRIVSRSKLARQKKAMAEERRALLGKRFFVGRVSSADRVTLSEREMGRLRRLARIWTFAVKVWQDAESARAFLFRPHPMLEGQKPVDVALASEHGAERVRNILGGLLYGTAA